MHQSVANRNIQLDAALAELDHGYIKVYTGARPATPETAASGTLLATIRLGTGGANGAFLAASSASAIAIPVSSNETNAPASGTAGYARLLKTDGTTAVYDCSVGLSGAEVNLDKVVITAMDHVNLVSLVIAIAAGS